MRQVDDEDAARDLFAAVRADEDGAVSLYPCGIVSPLDAKTICCKLKKH
jgi:hypothetical protein